LGGRIGSITAIGAVSPPGGDFSEPVTHHTQRFTRCFWGLDRKLASARHFPAVNWHTSYSFYADSVAEWWQNEIDADWSTLRQAAADLLEQEARLQQIVRLVGADALPDSQRWTLDAAHVLVEGFLQLNALHPVDAFTVPSKQVSLLRLFVKLYDEGRNLVTLGVPVLEIRQVIDAPRLIRLKEEIANEDADQIEQICADVCSKLRRVGSEHRGIR
jgi:V/A-type H+-transporting ATPase subunit A